MPVNLRKAFYVISLYSHSLIFSCEKIIWAAFGCTIRHVTATVICPPHSYHQTGELSLILNIYFHICFFLDLRVNLGGSCC